jgi:DNA mismatch endonuclease, patch repair protein
MQAIRSTDTKIEVTLGKALWSLGYRYRKNVRTIFGTPDFVFRKRKVCVFCDSEFWHGKDWETLNRRLQVNRAFWVQKIERNIARDLKVNEELKRQGWTVLRFWETAIKKELPSVVATIESHLKPLQAPCNSRETPL